MPQDKDDYIALLRKRVAAQDTSQLPKHLLRRLSLRGPAQEPPAEENQGIDFSKLDEDPELQQSLAYLVQYTPSKWLLEQEAALLADRRDLHHPDHPMPRFQQGNENIYDWARRHRLTGLCFSGGGIRSATFNLGILQDSPSRAGSTRSTISPASPEAATSIPGWSPGSSAKARS